MYILVISRGYPSPDNPLRGIFEFDQAQALRDAGHKVVFLSLDLRSVRRKRKLGLYQTQVEGVDIVNMSFPVGNVPAWLFVFIGQLVIERAYRLVCKQHGKPDILHAHFSDISAISTKLSKKHAHPLVVTEHSSLVNTNIISSKTNYFCQIAYKHADKLIAVSEALAKQIKKHFNFEAEVVHNVVDVNSFSFQPQNNHKGFHFISVGNLKPVKGFDILINAFNKIRQNRFSLIIVGKGSERPKLQTQINRLGLGGKICLAGQKTRAEINQLMQKSDAFVLASKSETFGVAYIEAMAAGLPVIATRCGGPEDFVNQSNGLLVEVDNVEQLAQAMVELHKNYHKYDRGFIASSCRESFGPKAIAQKLKALYKQVINAA
jgi:L-malate glycosyltransferase